MSVIFYPSVAKVKRNGVYENLPGFSPESSESSAEAMIAIGENNNTAQYYHPKNSFFRLNGKLYQADQDIAINDTIAVGSNCHVAILGDEVSKLINDLNDIVVSVEDFGADPTGLSDSTNAIRNAIASIDEGTVYFPKGTYLISDSITLKSGIKIVGHGMFTTYICPDISVMGIGVDDIGTLVEKPAFKTTSAIERIEFDSIGFDCTKYDDPTKISVEFLRAFHQIDEFVAHNIHSIGSNIVFKFKNGSDYQFRNIICDCRDKTLPMRCENVVSFNGNSNIVVDGIIAREMAEIIDFAHTEDAVVNNVVGISTFSGEDEAFDIGASSNITISNVVTEGFSEAVKLKNENGKVSNIKILNCSFNGFKTAGIYFKADESMNDYAIDGVEIGSCNFKTSIANARAFSDPSSNANYGINNINIHDCNVNVDATAITASFTVFNNIKIYNCNFKGGITQSCVYLVLYASAKDSSKNGNVEIYNNRFDIVDNSTNGNANIIYVNGFKNPKIINNIVNCDAHATAIYLVNTVNQIVKNNTLNNLTGGIISSTDYSVMGQVANGVIKSNEIHDCATGINFSLRGTAVEYAVVGIVITDNVITNSTVKTNGIVLSARNLANGIDYSDISRNLIINVTNVLKLDQVTLGEHVVNENISYNQSA